MSNKLPLHWSNSGPVLDVECHKLQNLSSHLERSRGPMENYSLVTVLLRRVVPIVIVVGFSLTFPLTGGDKFSYFPSTTRKRGIAGKIIDYNLLTDTFNVKWLAVAHDGELQC